MWVYGTARWPSGPIRRKGTGECVPSRAFCCSISTGHSSGAFWCIRKLITDKRGIRTRALSDCDLKTAPWTARPYCQLLVQNLHTTSANLHNPECSRMFPNAPECSRMLQNAPESNANDANALPAQLPRRFLLARWTKTHEDWRLCLLVECLVAIEATRVRFPADTFLHRPEHSGAFGNILGNSGAFWSLPICARKRSESWRGVNGNSGQNIAPTGTGTRASTLEGFNPTSAKRRLAV